MKGKLTISRRTNNVPGESGYINLELTDAGFKVLFHAETTFADFAKAITGMAFIPCDYKVWDREV